MSCPPIVPNVCTRVPPLKSCHPPQAPSVGRCSKNSESDHTERKVNLTWLKYNMKRRVASRLVLSWIHTMSRLIPKNSVKSRCSCTSSSRPLTHLLWHQFHCTLEASLPHPEIFPQFQHSGIFMVPSHFFIFKISFPLPTRPQFSITATNLRLLTLNMPSDGR